MKQLVVYSSQGGNTRKLAEFVFSRLSGDKEISAVAEAPDPSSYDTVVVAFWFQGGQPDTASREYLKKCAGSGSIFLVATHGSAPDSDHSRMGMNKAIELVSGRELLGTFNCQGEVPAAVLESAANKNPQPPWLADAAAGKGHPDSNDMFNLAEALEKAGLIKGPEQKEKRMFS
jgi:flavodoxin